jgi:hypothetical protein
VHSRVGHDFGARIRLADVAASVLPLRASAKIAFAYGRAVVVRSAIAYNFAAS